MTGEFDPVDRPERILTRRDREYLLGRLDLSKYDAPENTEYRIRHDIRERFRQALIDLTIIEQTLSHKDRKAVFEELEDLTVILQHSDNLQEARRHKGEFPMVTALSSMINLVVLATFPNFGGEFKKFFEKSISNTLNQMWVTEFREYRAFDVDMDISGDRDATTIPLNREELVDYLNEDEQIGVEEAETILVALVDGGHISNKSANMVYSDLLS